MVSLVPPFGGAKQTIEKHHLGLLETVIGTLCVSVRFSTPIFDQHIAACTDTHSTFTYSCMRQQEIQKKNTSFPCCCCSAEWHMLSASLALSRSRGPTVVCYWWRPAAGERKK